MKTEKNIRDKFKEELPAFCDTLERFRKIAKGAEKNMDDFDETLLKKVLDNYYGLTSAIENSLNAKKGRQIILDILNKNITIEKVLEDSNKSFCISYYYMRLTNLRDLEYPSHLSHYGQLKYFINGIKDKSILLD